MPVTYQKNGPGETLFEHMANTMKKYHRDLHEAKVDVNVLVASGPRD